MEIQDLYKLYLSIKKICTDTRQIRGGEMFFALKGPNFDGNAYAKDAISKGANLAIIDDPEYKIDGRHILVDNVLQTLQDLATWHRANLDIPVLAIGGSNGKTTTKELVYQALARKYSVFATKGNLNNHIGVPLSILSIGPEVEIAVIEMGANHEGEIAELCEIAQPTHGIVTNIGYDHLEGFGSIEGVGRANAELYTYLRRHEGIAFVESGNTTLAALAGDVKQYTYFAPGDDHHCQLLEARPFLKIETGKGDAVQTSLIGQYNFLNVAAALAIAAYFEVDPQKASMAVAAYVPANNRSQVIEREGRTIVLDAYNANPSSVKVALESFVNMGFDSTCALLGDMYELGTHAKVEHAKVVRLVDELGLDRAYFCGAHFMEVQQETSVSGRHFFKDAQSLGQYLQRETGDSYQGVLVKGSRSMKMEDMVAYL